MGFGLGFLMILQIAFFSLILTKRNIVAGDGEIHCSTHISHSISLLSPVVNLVAVNVGQE